MYTNGQGVAQDYKEAVAWYRKAAEQGHTGAQNNLGVSYAKGQGVVQNQVIAYALYNLSSANDPKTTNNAVNNRNNLAKDLTAKELEAGQALTAKLAQSGMFIKALDAADKALPKAPVAQSAKPAPAAPVVSKSSQSGGDCRPRTSQLTCQSQCYNGDCEVTYQNGCKVRVQVNPKFDPFTSQWTYPSPSC
jgi:hypothetical protein